MPARRAAPSSTTSPSPAKSEATGLARDALLAALAERDRELAEAREQQAAVAEVLEVINASPGDLGPVFDTIVKKGARLCDADNGTLWLVEDGTARMVDMLSRGPRGPYLETVLAADLIGRDAQDRPFLHIADLKATKAYQKGVPLMVGAVEVGVRTALIVPLVDGSSVVGVFTLDRHAVRPFADRQIALARAFAGQASIAIKNARLHDESKKALEQQKASAEVLGAISKSVADTAPVFETILDACQRLFGSEEIGIYTIGDDQMVRAAAWRGPRAEEALRDVTPVGESVTGRLIRERRVRHIPDLVAEPGLSVTVRERAERLGSASLLYAPMLWEDRGLGSILVVRSPPWPFSEQEQALLRSFADQAAIAIENARLFNETKEALDRQTATANVLKVISRSVSDAAPVFETILESCQRLFGLEAVAVYLIEGDMVKGVAHRGWAVGDWGKDAMPLAGSSTGLAIAERRAIHIPDLAEKPGIPEKFATPLREGGGMSVLYAPMLSEDHGVGSIVVSRKPARPFSDKEIALVQSFADQAAIAIQNARLFEAVQAKTRDLEETLAQQTATADVLKVISRSAFDLNLAALTILEAAARLCHAPLATLHLRDGDVCRLTTQFGLPEAFEREARQNPIPVRYPLHARRTARAGEFAHFSDAWTDPDYLYKASARLGGYRALVVIPLMREGELVGIFSLGRPEPEAFTESQIKLTQTFADQAAIAVENARLFNEVKARTDDLTEALQQQTATADVLKVISRSAFDLQVVLDTLTASATKLCDGDRAAIFQRRGDLYHFVSNYGFSDEMEAFARANPLPSGSTGGITRAGRDRKPIHIPDVLADPDYTQSGYQSRGDYRTLLSTPLMRAGEPIGGFVITRKAVRPFNDRQIELLQTFADQAVIAIENVRLFEEVQARTHDLTEALHFQTATSDVLKAISQSPNALKPVLDVIVEISRNLCGAQESAVFMLDGGKYQLAADSGLQESFREFLYSNPISLEQRGSSTARAAREKRTVHIPDISRDPEYGEGPMGRGGPRALLSVPLMRKETAVGVITLLQPDVTPFSARQIEVVETFADQAIIAIENTRLFEEVQARTRDLTESLQQQTATADVLKVISRSTFDLQAVLTTLVDSARALCEAPQGAIMLREGDVLRIAKQSGYSSAWERHLSDNPPPVDLRSGSGRAILTGDVVHIPDISLDDGYRLSESQRLGGYRSLLCVPLLREREAVGTIVLTRPSPLPFAARQVELVKTFADQAVIAIENVRLFNEVQARTRDLAEALQQQTATADVLKVISRSAFDLQAVFDTLLASAVELCGAHGGTICVRDGDAFPYRASAGSGQTEALIRYLADHPATPGSGSTAGRVLLSGKVEAIPDCLEDPDYVIPMDSLSRSVRSILGVPLLRNDGVEGALVLSRKEPGYFTPRQVEIVKTFADQAVIAIENVRLFEQVQARTRELAASLDDLRRAQDRLIQSEKLASLGQLTAGIAHEIKNPLNFINNFSALSRELMDELREVFDKAPLADADREEAGELIGMIDANLDKVVSHGKRADSIVKNMLLHSREGSGERGTVNVNAMVEEALNLAYHGARAEKPGFNVAIAKSLDPEAGSADIYAQEMTRVLLNLISNGFYATTKRKQSEADPAYEPTITAATRNLGHSVEITIRDNGTGIPDEVKAKMFNPFFTTKPAGEGTGLGLSLSHDIVVKQHGGTIEVTTEPGGFTQFTLVLPRAGASA